MKWKHNIPKSLRCSNSSSRRQVYGDTGLPHGIRKTSSKLNYNLKQLKKEEQTNPKVSGTKGGFFTTELPGKPMTITNIIFNGEKLKAFLLKSGTRQRMPILNHFYLT